MNEWIKLSRIRQKKELNRFFPFICYFILSLQVVASKAFVFCIELSAEKMNSFSSKHLMFLLQHKKKHMKKYASLSCCKVFSLFDFLLSKAKASSSVN